VTGSGQRHDGLGFENPPTFDREAHNLRDVVHRGTVDVPAIRIWLRDPVT
jgi:hypothetical protein